MRYEITGDNLQLANIILSADESINVAIGSTIYTLGTFDVRKSGGGIIDGIRKVLTGKCIETMSYSPKKGVGTIGVGGHLPGRIMDLNIDRMSWIAQKDSFVASQPGITIDQEFQKRLGDEFGQEGLTLIKFGGKGMLFLFSLGDFLIFPLQKGDVYEVATDKAVAWESSVKYKIELDKALKGTFLGKDGPYVTKFEGPGRIVVQSMSMQKIYRMLKPYGEKSEDK
ncbi:MAG TPA: AIM24 family protein [Candidatus Methanomethylophilaceae archaeon]|nr:AIM24 family protein [Candidatus Methanomethylophilaceae archaeon]